ncbi:MAG: type II toxin-antitoxin system VapC family toxin [Candidatus Altiarchaeales archaeon]|nr:type II toxin-antitoxin system VapC family toxin [Candidatus Altiarchaeales archaeon]
MEKEALVLDASVIAKWFYDEEYTDKALEIRKEFFKGDIDIIVPELLFYEVSNALRYNKDIPRKDKGERIDDLSLIDFKVVRFSNKIASMALKTALDTNTTIYDSTYLAVARLNKCPLITADKEYIKRIKSKDVIFIGDI